MNSKALKIYTLSYLIWSIFRLDEKQIIKRRGLDVKVSGMQKNFKNFV